MRSFDFPQRATEAAAGALAGAGTNRRDFLVRVAAFGAAFATRPVHSLLRPESAYAACPDPGCASGFSAFCCTLTGSNSCPSGTSVGGWWYACVTSATCLKQVRYYLDCVGDCPGNCSGCHCRNDPPTRRVCCNTGYTNCGKGGILRCRIVRCNTRPDLLWPQCGSTGQQSQVTANHSASCLGGSKGCSCTVPC
jgi:hypothetical protein